MPRKKQALTEYADRIGELQLFPLWERLLDLLPPAPVVQRVKPSGAGKLRFVA